MGNKYEKKLFIGILFLVVLCTLCTSCSAGFKEKDDISANDQSEGQSEEGSVEENIKTNEKSEVKPIDVIDQSNNTSIPVVGYNVEVMIFKDYESLFEAADLVIVGEAKNDITEEEVIITYSDTDPSKYGLDSKKPLIRSVHTLREVMIHEILKGEIAGNTVYVKERTGLVDNAGEKTILMPYSYSYMQKGMKYLLFLSVPVPDSGDYYYIMSVNQGKFNIDGKDIMEKELEEREFQYSQLKKMYYQN